MNLRRRTPLRARRLYRRPPRDDEDKVTPDLRAYVLKRDDGCIARHYSPPWPCWGRITLDHVKDDPRMGDRAPSDRYHLVSICQGHSEDGRRAGYQWNTANRAAERDYLGRVEPR